MSDTAQLPDYEEAAATLRAILEARRVVLGSIHPLPKRDGELHMLRFLAAVRGNGTDLIECEYGAGVGLADDWARAHARDVAKPPGTTLKDVRRACTFRPGRASLCGDDSRLRERVRAQYRPTAYDVVAALLSDQACVEGYTDWMDWAEDLGQLGSAKETRQSRQNWDLIQGRTAQLRRLLGNDYAAALEASGRL